MGADRAGGVRAADVADQDDDVLARLFEPVALGPLELRNRLMMTTHGPRLSQRRYRPYLAARSAGVGLVGVFASYGAYSFPVGPGRFSPQDAADFDVVPPHPLTDDGRRFLDGLVPMMAELADTVHGAGARIVGQLLHLGGSQHDENFQPSLAPGWTRDEFRRAVPHALTTDEIAGVVEALGDAARRVADAGYDAVELAGGHGYLVEQFLSPLTNHRDDGYGGSAANRSRFLFEVLDAVRAAVGDGFPVGVRISGAQRAPGGLTNDDMCAVAARLGEWGVAYVNVSGGTYTGLQRGLHQAYVAPPSAGDAPNADDAGAIRRHTTAAVIVAGRFTDLRQAARVVAAGAADVVGMTRLLIADPDAPAKARRGRVAKARPCIGCNECHYGRTVVCTVNPAAGKEEELAVRPAAQPRSVLVVGGGPAGMEFARAAAHRGHRVRLVERGPALGGAVATWGTAPLWPDVPRYLDWLATQLDDLGVTVELGREVPVAAPGGEAGRSADGPADAVGGIDVADAVGGADMTDIVGGADVVVVATGAEEGLPDVPGLDTVHAVTALEALAEPGLVGDHVVVVGGVEDHLPPLAVADRLAAAGRRVTLLSEPMVAGEGIEPALLFSMTRGLLRQGVAIRTLTGLVSVDGGTVTVRNTLTGQLDTVGGVDTLVAAGLRRPRVALVDALRATGLPVHAIGDCLAPRRMVHATLDGARCAATL
ncbi:MAG TPA: FAD-dependent oxidoreductase [Acidimicrobiales bacterium]|nr:FAD-dependent oxidoreductase [Acidimicrobiales bacterium]